jgi:hypothetical protein
MTDPGDLEREPLMLVPYDYGRTVGNAGILAQTMEQDTKDPQVPAKDVEVPQPPEQDPELNTEESARRLMNMRMSYSADGLSTEEVAKLRMRFPPSALGDLVSQVQLLDLQSKIDTLTDGVWNMKDWRALVSLFGGLSGLACTAYLLAQSMGWLAPAIAPATAAIGGQ